MLWPLCSFIPPKMKVLIFIAAEQMTPASTMSSQLACSSTLDYQYNCFFPMKIMNEPPAADALPVFSAATRLSIPAQK